MHTFPPVCLKLDTAALTQNSQTRTGEECGVKIKNKEREVYSLGSSKALAQLLHQGLRLPFLGDV